MRRIGGMLTGGLFNVKLSGTGHVDITTHYEPEAMLNRKMVEAARMVIAISDSSKFGKVCLHRIIPVG